MATKQRMRNEREGVFFFQAEDGIRDAQECRGLGEVYKGQDQEKAVKVVFPEDMALLYD